MAPFEAGTFIPLAEPLAPSIPTTGEVIPKPVTVIDQFNIPALNLANISEVQPISVETQSAYGGSLIPPTPLETAIQSGEPEIIQPITVIDRKHAASNIPTLQDVSKFRLTTDETGLVSPSDLQESHTIFERKQPKMAKDETPKGQPWTEEELETARKQLEILRKAQEEERNQRAAQEKAGNAATAAGGSTTK